MNRTKLIAALKKVTGSTYKANTTITVTYKNVDYEVEIEATLSYESNYGADADNRRGVPMTWVEEIIATDILNGENLDEKDEKAIKELAEKEGEESVEWADFPRH